MKLGQLREEISKASLPFSADLINDFKSIIFETDKEKFHPWWGYFARSRNNIYNLPKIMLQITPWTLILKLYIKQSLYLVLTNVLSTSFLMFHITFDEISTTLSIQSWYKGRYTRHIWSNDMFILWNCISAFFYKDRECCLHILPKQQTFVH